MSPPSEETREMRSFFECMTVSVGMLAGLGVWGCGSGDFEARSSEPGAAGATGAAGASGSSGAAGSPAKDAGVQPDSGKPIKPEPTPECVVKPGADEPDNAFVDSNCDGIDGDAAHAVFVNPNGDDAASGASDAPVKTLGKAIELATGASKDVYVCNATYAENVSLAKSVRLFGGYDCDTWERSSKHATVAPSTGIPLRVSKVTDAEFEAIDFVAPDAIDASASSIAVVVAQSTGIAFRHSVIDAGMGANGTPGANGAAFSGAAPSGGDGQPNKVASCSAYSAAPGVCTSMPGGGNNTAPVCFPQAFASRGGVGGTGGNWHESEVATDGATPFQGGAGGKASSSGGAVGQSGAAGTPGTSGTKGGDIGSIVNGEYVASNAGTDGTDGLFGRGGGGGSGGWSAVVCQDICSTYFIGSGGGQGGYGGCGGSAGKGGGAGGASIAIVIVDSAVDLDDSTLRTSQGGKGGNGGKGALGQTGGKGGKGGTSSSSKLESWGKSGGAGGKGGDGGAGGPGGGGASVAIVVHGATQPTTTAITFELGTPGAGGLTANGTPGTVGASTSMLSL